MNWTFLLLVSLDELLFVLNISMFSSLCHISLLLFLVFISLMRLLPYKNINTQPTANFSSLTCIPQNLYHSIALVFLFRIVLLSWPQAQCARREERLKGTLKWMKTQVNQPPQEKGVARARTDHMVARAKISPQMSYRLCQAQRLRPNNLPARQ